MLHHRSNIGHGHWMWGQHDRGNFHAGCGWEGRASGVVRTTLTVEAGMAVSILAAADAFGADTLASVSADVRVLDRGLVSYAFGSVTAVAAASGGAGFADATTVVDMAGADIGTVRTHTVSDPSGAVSVETTTFAALGLKFDLPGLTGQIGHQEITQVATFDHAISGNLATFDAFVYAGGENTATDLQVDAIALQDEFSTVTLAAMAAASSSVTYTQIEGTRSADRIDGSASDDVVFSGRGGDTVDGRGGDDWLFGQDGDDRLSGGVGDDTIFGGDGEDCLQGGAGDDWLFGGNGRDTLDGDGGDDLLWGGDGRDTLKGGAGADLLFGGEGKDSLEGGSGDDLFVLGMKGGDGEDSYRGGQGADVYWIVGAFDDDVIWDFSLGEGDRLAFDTQMADEAITMRRAPGDVDDLEITIGSGRGSSTLTLDEFFRLNTDLASMPRRGQFSEAQVQHILDLLEANPDHPGLVDSQATYAFGDMLSLLG